LRSSTWFCLIWFSSTFIVAFEGTVDDHILLTAFGDPADVRSLAALFKGQFPAAAQELAWGRLKTFLKANGKEKDAFVWFKNCPMPKNYLEAWPGCYLVKAAVTEPLSALKTSFVNGGGDKHRVLDMLNAKHRSSMWSTKRALTSDEGDY
jgi:hypothetical protein